MQATASEDPRVKLKVCLAGERGVGKTSLVRRFVHDVFDDGYTATLGAKITKRDLTVGMPDSGPQGRAVLNIWDIMGATGLRDIPRDAYFHGVQGVLAVCDVTRSETLAKLEEWRKSIAKVVGPVPVYVLANKVDLVEEARVTAADVEAFCEGRRYPSLLTSAKTGEGVVEAFRRLTELVLQDQLGRSGGPPASEPALERIV